MCKTWMKIWMYRNEMIHLSTGQFYFGYFSHDQILLDTCGYYEGFSHCDPQTRYFGVYLTCVCVKTIKVHIKVYCLLIENELVFVPLNALMVIVMADFFL